MRLVSNYFNVRSMLPKSMQAQAEGLPESSAMVRQYVRIALPSVMEMALISLISMVDTVMVSGLGTDAVASVGLVAQPRMIMLSLFFALNTGITTVVARRKGENLPTEANATVRTAIVMMLVMAAVIMALIMPMATPLMLFAGAEPGRTLDAATEYFLIMGWALPFQALSMGLCAAQRGIGNTRLTMVVNITSNLVNILFNYLLINGIGPFPRLGVRGAALATALGLFVGFVLSTLSMFRGKGFLHLSLRADWRINTAAMRALVRVGSSAMAEQIAMRIGFFAYAKIIAGLGTDAFAAHQICAQFTTLSFSFADGLGIAGTSLVGQMLGRKRSDLAHVYGTLAQRFSFLIALVLASICILLRAPLVSLFISENAMPEVRPMAESVMVILGFFQPVQMLCVVVSGALRGAGDVKYTARVSLLTIALLRPVLALAGMHVGVRMLGDTSLALQLAWCATLTDMFIRSVLFMRRYRSGQWHSIRV